MVFDNDTEIFYTALMEGHSYVNNILTSYPKNLEKMGKRLFLLCKNEFKQIIRNKEMISSSFKYIFVIIILQKKGYILSNHKDKQ